MRDSMNFFTRLIQLLLLSAVLAVWPARAASDTRENENHDKLLIGAVEAVERQIAAMLSDAQKGLAPTPAKASPTGVDVIDEMTQVMLATALRSSTAAYKLNSGFAALNASSLMTADRLVTPEGIASGRQLMRQLEPLVEAFLAETRAALRHSAEQYRKIDFASGHSNGDRLQERVLSGVSNELDGVDRLESNYRALFDVERRIFDFAAARPGKLVLREGKLMLANNADLTAYNALSKELHQAMARLGAQR